MRTTIDCENQGDTPHHTTPRHSPNECDFIENYHSLFQFVILISCHFLIYFLFYFCAGVLCIPFAWTNGTIQFCSPYRRLYSSVDRGTVISIYSWVLIKHLYRTVRSYSILHPPLHRHTPSHNFLSHKRKKQKKKINIKLLLQRV